MQKYSLFVKNVIVYANTTTAKNISKNMIGLKFRRVALPFVPHGDLVEGVWHESHDKAPQRGNPSGMGGRSRWLPV